MLALIAEAEKLIAENATVAQDQTIYNQKFNKIYGSIEEKKAKIAEIDIQISEALARKEVEQIRRNVYRILREENGIEQPIREYEFDR